MNISFRPAEQRDARFVYDLRFRHQDSSCYFSNIFVSFEEHALFWEDNFKSYWIAEELSIRIGFYGIINEDFRYSVIPEYRGRGIGTYIVADAIKRLELRQVRVIAENISSIKVFRKNSFIVSQYGELHGIEYLTLSRLD